MVGASERYDIAATKGPRQGVVGKGRGHKPEESREEGGNLMLGT